MSFLSGLGGYLGQVIGTIPNIIGGLQTAGVVGGGVPRAVTPPGTVGTISKVAATGAPSLQPTALVGKAASTAIAVAQKHPILTAAGGAAATAGAVATLVRSRSGGVHPAVKAAMGIGRRRRMHVTNVKALRRSIRRLHGFEKVCRKVLRFTSPHRSHGRATFKRPKRRS